MKLPDFLLSARLNALRDEMGAPLTKSFRPQKVLRDIELPEVERRLRNEGIEVDLDTIQRLGDGTLAYKGHRVLLYIRDVASYGSRTALPKFHVAYCAALERMRRDNRFERYVVANNDSGKFTLNLMDYPLNQRARVEELNVCQFCLGTIGWKGFVGDWPRTRRQEAVAGFRLPEFFEKYPRDLLSTTPRHSSETAPLNDYTPDWPDISNRTKRLRNYCCEKCSIRLPSLESRYLHVHHRNGIKSNNSDRNLEVLCIRCHAEEPMHQHMKSLPDFLEFVEKYPLPASWR
jgi:hypothetical protein